jgi:hypothetical protein
LSDANVFGGRDLHVIDVIPIPHGLEARVGKSEYEHVLDGFFAEIVIDSVDLILLEHLAQLASQRRRARTILAEGFLDDHPAPPMRALRETGRAKSGHDDVEQRWRDRQVKQDVVRDRQR